MITPKSTHMEEWNPNQGHAPRLRRVNVSWDGVNETIPEGVFDAAGKDLGVW